MTTCPPCRICGSTQIKSTFQVREMMFGTQEKFDYFECGGCGCLQIAAFPSDMAKYYDAASYYSLQAQNLLRRRLRDLQIGYLITGKGLIGRALAALKPSHHGKESGPKGVAKTAKILDIGCGKGVYLNHLAEIGFKQLHGIDPFLLPEYIREKPYPLQRKTVFQISPEEYQFDLITANHTFEHVAEQHEFLAQIRKLLAAGGLCIIRIPFASSFAWEHYGADWAQLDPPRHFFIHTRTSLGIVAERADLEILEIECDSNGGQFWASEQYQQNIPLYSDRSVAVNPNKSIFTASRLQEFSVRAEELNQKGRGDQVAVYLKKT